LSPQPSKTLKDIAIASHLSRNLRFPDKRKASLAKIILILKVNYFFLIVEEKITEKTANKMS
jgi:hypothetical protein